MHVYGLLIDMIYTEISRVRSCLVPTQIPVLISFPPPLTQPPRLGTPRATKLQLRRIRHLHDLISQHTPLAAQQHFRHGLAAGAEPLQHDLHGLDVSVPAALVQLVDDVGGELVGGVVGAALGLLEANVAGGHGDDGVAVGLGHGDVRVVLVRVHVEVERLVRRAPVLPVLGLLFLEQPVARRRLVAGEGERVLREQPVQLLHVVGGGGARGSGISLEPLRLNGLPVEEGAGPLSVVGCSYACVGEGSDMLGEGGGGG